MNNEAEAKTDSPAPSGDNRPPRVPGSMKDEIWIAPDFDDIPEDFSDLCPPA
jgi:hypothetical protein